MGDITREQYDHAVRIRENGYTDPSFSYIECNRTVVDQCISTYEAEHPEEFRNMPNVGDGWRILERWETIAVGDEYLLNGIWKQGGAIGSHPIIVLYRRRIAKPPRIYDYRDVDLPEVKALIGKEVYVSDSLEEISAVPCHAREMTLDRTRDLGYKYVCGEAWQFIRAIDDQPKIKLTRSELIAIAATSRGVTPEQIVVEE